MSKKFISTVILVVLTMIAAFAVSGLTAHAQDGGCDASVNYFEIGREQFAARDLENALNSFNCAIQLDPTNPRLHYWRGKTFCNMKQPEKAAENYEHAIDLDPDYALAWNNHGWANYLMGEYETALNSLNTAISLDAKLSYAYNNRGLVYLAFNESEKALADFQKAIDLGIVHPWAEINLYNLTHFGQPDVTTASAAAQ